MNDRPKLPHETDPDRGFDSGAGSAAGDSVRIRFLGRKIALPRSFALRTALGVCLVLFGTLGFLPVLGFWMIPVGLLVLSYDFAFIRRQRRRISLWWGRRRANNGRTTGINSE